MATHTNDIRAGLAELERELARPAFSVRFHNAGLESEYARERQVAARLHNRAMICVLYALLDLFMLGEIGADPEVLRLSAVLRLAVVTPAMLAYVVVDWRGKATRWIPAIVCALLIAPTAINTLEAAYEFNPLAVANFSAEPLTLLSVIACRLGMRQVITVNLVSCFLFIGSALTVVFLPGGERVSLILTDLSLGIGTLLFAWRMDMRDRKMFLFTRQAALGRDMLAAQNRSLARLSQVDALTGLGNRRCFDEAVASIWADAAASPIIVSLVLFDIDCFKQFNDALGHQAGDECLGAVARAVTRCLRDEGDILVRYGGEEFAIILPGTSLEEGCALAERVRLSVLERALPHPGGGPHHLVTISLGVACVMAPVQTASALVEAADQLLYVAKRHGRNRVESGLPAPPCRVAAQVER